jgi:HSP20 family protein
MALLRFYNPVPTSYRWNDVYNPYNEFERHFNPANNCYCGDDRLPSANISESDSEYRIMMALPGVDKDKISINLDKGVLSVKVENNEQKEEDTVYSYREFNVADASRSFQAWSQSGY